MTIKISFDQKDKQQVKQNHSESISEAIARKIQNKNETLRWVDDFNACRQRFYNIIGANGYFFPEIWFSPNRKDYRAILVWIRQAKTIDFLCVVEKETRYQSSNQAKIIQQIENHPEKIVQNSKERLARCSTE